MLCEHNAKSFLTGDEPFLALTTTEENGTSMSQRTAFDDRHEGFIGIPHGGLAMGLCVDAWLRMEPDSYPFTVRCKFGGSGVAIGDPVTFDLERPTAGDGPAAIAKLTKEWDKTPYLRAEFARAESANVAAEVPGPLPHEIRPLPYYKNCFVCGRHRDEPGLQRRFQVHSPGDGNIVSVRWGDSDEDRDRADLFRFGAGELHPALLTAIFDENTGWSGFMRTRSSGLSVRLNMTLVRPVATDEPLLVVGWPTGTRGNSRKPRFFSAQGTVLSMKDPGNPEPVLHGGGEWITMDKYTDQTKRNLLPADSWQWIFGDDEE